MEFHMNWKRAKMSKNERVSKWMNERKKGKGRERKEWVGVWKERIVFELEGEGLANTKMRRCQWMVD